MKKWFSLILIAFFASRLMASAISFEASTSHDVVEVGQRFRVTFTVNGGGGNFTPPDFNGFRVLSGPNQSRNMQYVNGKMTQSFTVSYILQALKVGKYEIGPALMVIDGEELKTKNISIEVVEPNNAGANAQNQRQGQRKSDGNELSDYIYIKAFVDKGSAYVGENITATFKLYSKINIASINLESLPDLNGFWSHDIRSVYDQIQLSTEYIGGEVYQVATLKQSLLYPQRAGELIIDPLSMKAVVQVRSRRSRSLFESMFGSYENKEIILSSQPLKVKVNALPKYQGEGKFSGAVGNFNIQLTANKNELKANEAVDLSFVVSGSGNLPLIGAPQLSFPPDLEAYDPEIKNNFKNSSSGSTGSKSFNYLLIPRHSGEFIIPEYKFTYFDLGTKTYKTLKTPPLPLKVAKGEEEANVVYKSADRKEEVELLEQDIRFIHLSNLMLLHPEDQFYGSSSYYFIIGALTLLLILLFFLSKRYKEKQADTVGLRKGKAKKLAAKRMSKAKKYLDKQELAAFYEEIAQALYGYFADRYNMGIADLSKESLLEKLKNESATTELLSKLSNTIDEAEMARYAPSSGINANELYERSKEIIEETEGLKK